MLLALYKAAIIMTVDKIISGNEEAKEFLNRVWRPESFGS
jgi:hypothetical protein